MRSNQKLAICSELLAFCARMPECQFSWYRDGVSFLLDGQVGKTFGEKKHLRKPSSDSGWTVFPPSHCHVLLPISVAPWRKGSPASVWMSIGEKQSGNNVRRLQSFKQLFALESWMNNENAIYILSFLGQILCVFRLVCNISAACCLIVVYCVSKCPIPKWSSNGCRSC